MLSHSVIVCAYYDKTEKCPTTSGSTPNDFEQVYDRLFVENPDIQILHLAYSAVTTCHGGPGAFGIVEMIE